MKYMSLLTAHLTSQQAKLPLLLESNICVGSQQLSLAGRVCESKREGGEV